MNENEVSKVVVDAALKVHRHLGPGLLESVYQRALAFELRRRGLEVHTEVSIDVVYDGVVLGDAFRVDMIVERIVYVELKSIKAIEDLHLKQVLTYLRLGGARLGLLINFNTPLLRDGIRRVANGLAL